MLPLLSLVRNNIGPNNAAHVDFFMLLMHCKRKFALVCTLCSLSVEVCPGLTLIRCTQISISVTKCPLALLANFNITCVSEYRQFMSQCPPNSAL